MSDVDRFKTFRHAVDTLGLKTERDLIQYHLNSSKLSFPEFLTKHDHKLYHLCHANTGCCRCKGIRFLPKNHAMYISQFKMIFDKNNLRRSCHDGRDGNCCLQIRSDVSIDELDLTMAHILLRFCCQDLFWKFNLEHKNKQLNEFLNEEKHDIYHLWKKETRDPCSMCTDSYEIRNVKEPLDKHEWELLYETQNIDNLPLTARARTTITESEITDEMALIIFDRCCSLMNIIKKLRQHRNYMAHHTTQTMSEEKFQSGWNFLKDELILAAEFCHKEHEFQDQLNSILPQFTPVNCTTIGIPESVEYSAGDTMVRICQQCNWEKFQNYDIKVDVHVNSYRASIHETSLHFIPKRDRNDSDISNSQSDNDGDEYHCGKCKGIFSKLEDFTRHKKECGIKKTTKSTGIQIEIRFQCTTDETKEVLDFGDRSRQERSTDDVKVLDESEGSLVIWTRMSSSVMKTKELFLLTMGEFVNRFFLTFPKKSLSTEVETIEITVHSDDLSGDDEEDFFKCGRCRKTFYVLQAFVQHKKTRCHILPHPSDPVDETYEINIQAFTKIQRFESIVHNVTGNKAILEAIGSGLKKSVRVIIWKKDRFVSLESIYGVDATLKWENRGQHSIQSFNPEIVFCILETTKGHLTEQDIRNIKKMEESGNFDTEKTIFLTKCESVGFRDFHVLSLEIGQVLKCKNFDIFPRIFSYSKTEYTACVNEILSYRFKTLDIDKYAEQVQRKKDDAKSGSTRKDYERYLKSGPLGDDCKQILRDAARSYYWYGESFFRSKWRVEEAREKIFRYVCEQFSKELVTFLVQKFKSMEVTSDDYDFIGILLRNIKMEVFEDQLNANVMAIIIGVVWDSLKQIFMVIVVFFLGVDVNSSSFRDEIADKTCSEIQRNQYTIANQVVVKFLDIIRDELENVQRHIVRIKRELDTDITYEDVHWRHIIAIKRHPLVLDVIPPETTHGKLKVSVEKKEHEDDVKDFIDKFLGYHTRFNICSNQH